MNYCKLFRENAGKKASIKMTDGEIFEGKFAGYISSADNEPEPESILIDNIELYTNEIESVTFLD